MEERHRTRPNPAFEPIPHHQVIPLAQLVEDGLDAGEVVAVVGIAHDDERPAGVVMPPMSALP